MSRNEYRVAPEQAGLRLDRAAALLDGSLTRAHAQKLIETGGVLVNGRRVDKNLRLKQGDSVLIELPEPQEAKALPQAIPLTIVYEDYDLLVVDKPQGMVVHPSAGHADGTLVNALLYHCGGSLSGINGVLRPGIVHRIDKNTSGLLIVAKNDFSHQKLAAQIKAHSFTRIYEAVVLGRVRDDAGTVDAPIGRHPTERRRMAVTDKNARHAVTHYEVLGRFESYTHVRLRLETGRTHQIRVHMAFIGHPVAGDDVYGPKKRKEPGLCGQCLHARTIGFIHPRTGKYMEFSSPLPDYFRRFLRHIGGA